MSGTGGIATAIELALADGAGAGELTAEEQAELFAHDADMPSMMPASRPKSGPQGGRPAGVRNKSTEAMRSLFLSKFRHPMMVLGEMYSRTPEDLARELKLYKFHEGKLVIAPVLDANGVQQCDEKGEPRWQPVLATGEAADLQHKAAVALLPYLASKMPIEIKTNEGERSLFVVGDLNMTQNNYAGDQLPLPPDPVDVTPNEGNP